LTAEQGSRRHSISESSKWHIYASPPIMLSVWWHLPRANRTRCLRGIHISNPANESGILKLRLGCQPPRRRAPVLGVAAIRAAATACPVDMVRGRYRLPNACKRLSSSAVLDCPNRNAALLPCAPRREIDVVHEKPFPDDKSPKRLSATNLSHETEARPIRKTLDRRNDLSGTSGGIAVLLGFQVCE
jgi:hypothetical protein